MVAVADFKGHSYKLGESGKIFQFKVFDANGSNVGLVNQYGPTRFTLYMGGETFLFNYPRQLVHYVERSVSNTTVEAIGNGF